jgi:hypothetical protein
MPDDQSRIGATVDQVVEAYSLFLEVSSPPHRALFNNRLKNDHDAARSEAVMFSWLRSRGFHPEIAENLDSGGVDFSCCSHSEPPFLVEVTKLDKNAVESRSGLPDEIGDKPSFFSMVTSQLWSKTKHKAAQLGNAKVPRLLAVCLLHSGADILLGTLAAEWLMTAEPTISAPIGSSETENVTNLKKAAFIQIRDGQVVPVRRSISAILLTAIWHSEISVVGLLHPDPAMPFDYKIMREIPFLRLCWPVANNSLHAEWVIAHPHPTRFLNVAVRLDDAELKS